MAQQKYVRISKRTANYYAALERFVHKTHNSQAIAHHLHMPIEQVHIAHEEMWDALDGD